VRRAHQLTLCEQRGLWWARRTIVLSIWSEECQRLCPPYKLRLTLGRSTRTENALTLGGSNLQRRLQRPRQLARTLAQGVVELTQLRPHGRDRPRLDHAVGLELGRAQV